MSDVFISYSRKDNREFAMEIKVILEANGHKVWIGLDDMAKASDFLKQIYEAIENPTDFLVIISRLSLTSEYCNLEIQRARHTQEITAFEAAKREAESQQLAARAQIGLEGSTPNAEIAALLDIRVPRSAKSYVGEWNQSPIRHFAV